MGNPAGVLKKKREKRRLKFENRFEGLAYVPKAVRDEVNAAIAAEIAKNTKK